MKTPKTYSYSADCLLVVVVIRLLTGILHNSLADHLHEAESLRRYYAQEVNKLPAFYVTEGSLPYPPGVSTGLYPES
jgi:hypothetical protein